MPETTTAVPTAEEAEGAGRRWARQEVEDYSSTPHASYTNHLDFLDRNRDRAFDAWDEFRFETVALHWDEDGEETEEAHEARLLEPLKDAFEKGWNAFINDALTAAAGSQPSA